MSDTELFPAAERLAALIRARDYLSDPARWIQSDWFRWKHLDDSDEEWVACGACTLGAIGLVHFDRTEPLESLTYDSEADLFLRAVANDLLPVIRERFPKRDLGPDGDDVQSWNLVARFNDDPATTHADVLGVFDEAINRLQAAS